MKPHRALPARQPVAPTPRWSFDRAGRSAPESRRGFALESTLIFLVLLAALIGAMLTGIVVVQRTASVDYRGSRVDYAAEAEADHIMSQLAVDMLDGVLSDAELTALAPPSIPGFTITASATRVGSATPRTITSGPYAGLYGMNQRIDIPVSARDPLAHRSDVVVSVNAQSIPLFQFGVFYDRDLEILNGPPMTFAGWVHTNGNLYLTSNTLYFQDIITTPGSVYWQRKDYSNRLNGVYINKASGTPVQLDFDSRSDPLPASFIAKSQSHFDGRLMTGASGVSPLRLPLPTGMPAIQLVQPRNGGDNQQLQEAKMAWKADYHLTVDLQSLASACTPGVMTVLPRPGGRTIPTAAECASIFTLKPNAFVEGREDIGVDLLDINVGALQTWIAADPAHRQIDIMYITFINASSGGASRDYPAVRLRNGAQLRAPWTLATDRPLYVWGHFNNNATWYPAALMADAVTFLSNEWTDAAHASFSYTANTTEMWVYAAIAAGHSATPCDWQASGCAPTTPPPLAVNPPYNNYGGGLENFPRFLENWGGSSGRMMHYRGSLVSFWESQYANRYRWSWRDYYNPPQRDWQFDVRFRDPTRIPPGTPTAGSVTQIAFRPVY